MTAQGRFVRFKLRKNTQDRLRALRSITSDAARHVPFYQDTFSRAGVRLDDLRSREDLQRYPTADKKVLLASGRDGCLRAGAEEQTLVRRTTTGTHGTPITVFAGHSEALFRKAALLDSFRRLTKLLFPLAIADVGVEQGKVGSDIVQALYLVNAKCIFRAAPLAEQVLRMSCLSPRLIEGRPSSLRSVVLTAR